MRLLKSKSSKFEISQLNIEPPKQPGAETGIAFAVLVKNEAQAIAEWLQFHHAAGVDAFLLYDDGSSDDTARIAQGALPDGSVTVIPWSQRLQDANGPKTIHNQPLAFAHAVSNYGSNFRWMGFFDVDEFLYPTKANSLKDVLKELDHVSNILLPWAMFGRQGHQQTPALALPNFTQRMRDPRQSTEKGLHNFKCLVRPKEVTKVYVHGFETRADKRIWNSHGQAFNFGEHFGSHFDPDPQLRLNHYYAKSAEQLAAKIQRGSIGHSGFTRHFKNHESYGKLLTRRVEEVERDTVEDRGILEFAQRIGWRTG